MSRRIEEFYCAVEGQGCGRYFLTHLRESFFGNYTVECPGCKHHHFRVIKNGLVTDDRHDERLGTAEIIIGLKSTLRDTPYHDDADFRRRLMRDYNATA